MFKKIKEKIKLWLKKQELKNKPVGYLGRDLSQHRVHTTKYEDLCK